MASDSYVFLSHSSADGQAARRLAETLRSNGFKVWLDEDDLAPGDRWMERLEKAVQGAAAMVVLVGRVGVQRWVDREVRLGLVRSTQEAGSGPKAVSDEYWIDHSPFRRLQVFEAEDSWLFFGRDSEVDDLLSRVARAEVLAVVGNSGSGKSSLIRAGLVPAVRRGRVHTAREAAGGRGRATAIFFDVGPISLALVFFLGGVTPFLIETH
jgi:hypothetical protein